MKVSVCIAAYNGEKYLTEQIDSILEQLSASDELVVVDDCSKDRTLEILEGYQDPRFKIFKNETNRSHVYSFGRVVSLASNEIIFMADQDDLWVSGRLQLMKRTLLENKKILVTSNCHFMDSEGKKIDFILDGVSSLDSNKNLKNILAIFEGKTNYFGCAMAFEKKLTKVILPIPSYVESHDLWIALAGNLLRSNIHIDDKTFVRRIHGNNVSVISRPLLAKLKSRLIFARSIIHLMWRIYKIKQ